MKEMQLENLRGQYKKIFLSFSLPSPNVLRGWMPTNLQVKSYHYDCRPSSRW